MIAFFTWDSKFGLTVDDETAALWEQWSKTFVKKVRYHEITKLQDQLDALDIYGGPEVESLLETLPQVQDHQVTVLEGEIISDNHISLRCLKLYYFKSQ